MINPKDYESKKEIKYCVENWIGGPVFKSYNQEGLELEFVLDTTGVLTKLGDDKFGKSLKSLINDLSETVYQYIGTVHQPGFVKVIWGELNFQGRLQQMDIKYTMFDPNGAPLRATVQLKLIRYTDVKTFRLQMSNSSPDLSHVVTVKTEIHFLTFVGRFMIIQPIVRRWRASMGLRVSGTLNPEHSCFFHH